MAKRGAGYELTHDNWDDEAESEEAGVFVPATANELKTRIIKRARRRGAPSSEGVSSPFAAFSGFGSGTDKPALGGFSFANKTVCATKLATNGGGSDNNSANNTTAGSKPSFGGISFGNNKDNGLSTTSTKPKVGAFSFGSGGHVVTTNVSSQSETASTTKDEGSSDEGSYSNEYYKSLKCLNEGFLSWIQKHMYQSSFCIFTPVFTDYENHLSALEKKYKIDKSKTASVSSTGSTGFSVGASAFSSGLDRANSSEKPTSGFSFAATPASEPGKRLISFPKADESTADEDEKPPEDDVKEVVEEDAFYSQKCKLFFKKSGTFVEKGKGSLFLKKADGKTQLLVRAATNLGNILLNIFLTATMPASRVGKNNVMIVCVPNPPIDPKQDSSEPVPMLIRVRTSDDADEVLKTINDNKNE